MGTVSRTEYRRNRIGRIAGVVVAGLLACVAAAGLGGCNNELKDKNAALTQENQELRDRNTQLETSLQTAEATKAQNEQMRTSDASGGGGGGGRSSARGGRGGPKGDWNDPDVTISRHGNDVVVAVAGDVLFDSGQAILKTSAKRTLDKVAANLKSQYSGNRVRVEGYTDTDPIKKSKFGSNEKLSNERARVVENYLISKGVSKTTISAVGMGSSNPKSTKKESRRVEIVIMDSAG